MSSGPGSSEDPPAVLNPAEIQTPAESSAVSEDDNGARSPRSDAHVSGYVPPRVEIGGLLEGGLAPAVAAIVERGVRRRPHRANRLRVEVEIKVVGPYPATRVRFGPGEVLVEDGAAADPDLRVEGALPDLVALLATPQVVGGLPNPITPRGRLALSKLATHQVRFQGPVSLRRELLALLGV